MCYRAKSLGIGEFMVDEDSEEDILRLVKDVLTNDGPGSHNSIS